MQNNAGGRHEIHAYPVTVLYKARKNRHDYYMEQKTHARSLARSLVFRVAILGATAGNEIFYYSPLLQTRFPFSAELKRTRKNNNAGQICFSNA